MNAQTQTLAPNKTDISAHLYALFDPSFVQAYPDAWIEIAYGYALTGGEVNAAQTFSVFQLQDAAKFAEAKNRAGYNIYVGPAIRQGSRPATGRAVDRHVATATFSWAEFDGEGDAERIRAILKERDLAPGMIVTTGRVPNLRAHLYFRLAEIVAPEKLRAANESLVKCLGGDSVQNPSRVMRLAGTVNYPPPDKQARGYVAELVTLQSKPEARTFSAEELIGLTGKSSRISDFFSTKPGRGDSELMALLEASRKPGKWHDSIRDAIATMIGRGWPDAAIKLACAPYCRGGADDADLIPLIKGAREKWNKPNEEQTSATATPPSDPVDLWAKLAPPTLPRGLLPDVIERFAFDQGTVMGADMAGIAVGALVVCAAAIPDGVQLQVKRHNPGWRESARLWAALVGPVSAKKSPILSSVIRPLRRIDSEMARRYSEERGLFDSLPAEERKKTNPPKHARLILQDTTIEAAQDIFKDSVDGVLSYHDELSGWFGSMDKYNGARSAAKDRAFWLEAYNGGEYSVNRVGRGSTYISNLSASILGGIQPEPIRKLADESADDGLLQRLLPVVLRPAVEGRDEPQSDAVAEYSQLINRLHSMSAEKTLRFDDAAQKLRQDLERKHLELQSIEGVNRKLAAHIGKYDGIFARLCVVWHCVENAGSILPLVITEATAKRAAGFLHGFFLPHALAFYVSTLGLSNDHDRLAAVAGYILARKLERITNRDVQRGDRTMRGLGRREIEAVFDQLDALGWVDRIPGHRPTDSPRWIVNPVVHTKFAERAEAEKGRRERERETIASLLKGQTRQEERRR